MSFAEGLIVGILGLAAVLLLAILYGIAVMFLWNWLVPVIFGLQTISFGQAYGLVVLCHCLFPGSSTSST